MYSRIMFAHSLFECIVYGKYSRACGNSIVILSLVVSLTVEKRTSVPCFVRGTTAA